MAISFLNGSYQSDLETRVSNGGGNGGGLAGRVSGCESRLDDMESSLGSRTSVLNTNYNEETLLEELAAALNVTNSKVNQHDDVLAAKGWLS